MILWLITQAAACGFGNSMTRCTGCGFRVHRSATCDWPLFLSASLRTATGSGFLPFRILAIGAPPRCCRTSPPLRQCHSIVRTRAERDCIPDSVEAGLGLALHPCHHHVKEQAVPAPATNPVHSPTVDLLAQGGRLAKAQKFRLHLHVLYAPHTSMALWSETVNC